MKNLYAKCMFRQIYTLFSHPLSQKRPTILLYVVRCCTKGVVELTYEWCHVIIPLLCCNELYTWWTVTPHVCSGHICRPHTGHCPGLLPVVQFGELVYGVYTQGEPSSPKISMLWVQGSPYWGHFVDGWNFLYFCVFSNGDVTAVQVSKYPKGVV